LFETVSSIFGNFMKCFLYWLWVIELSIMTRKSHYMMIMACCQKKFGYLITTIVHEWFQHKLNYFFVLMNFLVFNLFILLKKIIIIIKLNICKLRLLGVNYWP
jgi:hypothetical protein